MSERIKRCMWSVECSNYVVAGVLPVCIWKQENELERCGVIGTNGQQGEMLLSSARTVNQT